MPDLFTLTDQLVAARPLTREKVERLTGVELAPSHQGMNPFYALYESRGPRGYLKRVELREAKEGGTRQGGILILDLEPEAAQVVHSRISERYGKDFSYEPPQPNGPPKAPAYYLYKKAWGELRFGWGLSKGWVEVVVIDAE